MVEVDGLVIVVGGNYFFVDFFVWMYVDDFLVVVWCDGVGDVGDLVGGDFGYEDFFVLGLG